MIHFIGQSLFDSTSTLEDMYNYCADKEIIGLDIETTRKYPKNIYNESVYKPGLDPYMTNICMIQIGDLEEQFIIDARQYDRELLIKYLKPLLENKEILKIGQNLKFEGKFFLHHYGIEIKHLWDTYIAEKILYNGIHTEFSLEALMGRYLGIKSIQSIDLFNNPIVKKDKTWLSDDDRFLLNVKTNLQTNYVDKSTRLQFINIGDKPFTKKQIQYGADDITAPIKIYKEQVKGREVDGAMWNPETGFLLENMFTQILARVELKGMPLDSKKWLNLYEKNHKEYIRRLTFLNEYIEENYTELFCNGVDLFSKRPTCAIQWSSSKQVIKFFRHLGICPKEKSKSTGRLEWTVGAKSMFKLLDNESKLKFYKNKFPESCNTDNEIILAYLLCKKSEQLCTTFGKDFLQFVHPITGRVHSNFNQYMHTSRVSSSMPNCISLDTEVLTKEGWKNGSTLNKGEEIAAWSPGGLQWDVPTEYYYGYGEVSRYYKRNFDMLLTSNHRCLFQSRTTGKYTTKAAVNFLKDAKVLVTSHLHDGQSEEKALIQLVVAIQADAHLNKEQCYDFCFMKKRKFIRLISILKDLGISYKEINDKKRFRLVIRKSNIKNIDKYLTNKNFNWNLLSLDYASRVIFFEEIRYWDGNIKRHSQYLSKDKINIDIVTAIGVTIGKRIHYRTYERNDKLYPTIDIIHNRETTGTANTKIKKIGIHPIWCVKVSTGYFMARRNGQCFITGNCQNIPGFKDFRDCFTNSKSFINADFSGQESRILADISQVPALLDFYRKGHDIFGTDLHSYAATNMYRALENDPNLIITKETDREKRDNAKSFNFKINYGGSAYTIKDEIGKSLEETEELLKAYFNVFPGLEHSFNKRKRLALLRGWIQLDTYTDKRYFFPDFQRMKDLQFQAYQLTEYEPGQKIPEEEKIRLRTETNWSALWKEYMILKGKLERRGLNYSIQGAAASQTKLAGILFYKNRTDKSQEIMNIVHDRQTCCV